VKNIISFSIFFPLLWTLQSPPYLSAQEAIVKQQENFRTAPNGELIGTLKKGVTLKVLEEKGKWLRVSAEGWIYKPSVIIHELPRIPLPSLIDILHAEEEDDLSGSWLLFYSGLFSTPPKNMKSNADIIKSLGDRDLDASLENEMQKSLTAKFRMELLTLLGRYTGSHHVICKSTIFKFVNFHGEIGLVITGLTTDHIYNTLRTTSKSRAKKEIDRTILPLFDLMQEKFKDSEIKYFGAIVHYGSRNFAEQTVVASHEAACLACPKNIHQKFVNGQITEQDLLHESEVFIRTATGRKFRKTKIE